MSPKFEIFDGENLRPHDEREPAPSRRMSDASLEIIAHKISRLAGEFSEYKAENARAVERMEQSMRYTHATLTEATERAAKAAETAKESVREIVSDALSDAFPDGDPDGHRIAHEAWIKKVEESAAFWKKMREELIKYGLFAFLGFCVVAVWQSLVLGPPK